MTLILKFTENILRKTFIDFILKELIEMVAEYFTYILIFINEKKHKGKIFQSAPLSIFCQVLTSL